MSRRRQRSRKLALGPATLRELACAAWPWLAEAVAGDAARILATSGVWQRPDGSLVIRLAYRQGPVSGTVVIRDVRLSA